MILAERITQISKQKGLSQGALGKAIGTSGDVLGRYERGEVTPSIEVVVKLADALDVSIDYLVGKTAFLTDGTLLKRLQDIEALSTQDKNHILYTLDSLIMAAKIKAL